ncbi:MAG: rod shape-determining protein RodA [Nitrospinae bacterium]|nr:rod shape-determining protein RodA [Nitrospinota bacterium]
MNYGGSVEQGRFKDFDSMLLGMTLLLAAAGVLAIYSANMQSEPHLQGLYLRQAMWIGIALVAAGIATAVDYHLIQRLAYPIYALLLSALIFVEVSGHIAGGAQRWLNLGGVNLQPSEMMKLAVIILTAHLLDAKESEENLGFRELAFPLLMVAIPFLLVAKQPDLGTAGIYLILFGGMALVNGIRKGTLVTVAGLVAILLPSGWFLLKEYQKNRILTLLNPEADPMGQGYHTIQSKIAIGSGGLWGKGIFEGTQSKLNFLPEKHTDFIFSVVTEEIGFFGSLVLIALFFFLVMRLIDIIRHARDKFGALLVTGVTIFISFHALYNMGMTLGLFPIVGVPLPFISYGGSSLVTNFIAIGLALNVSLRRFSSEF